MSFVTWSAGPGVHAFAFSELGALCRTLRSVCLGLVELACPESRPAVAGPYRGAVHADHIQISGKNQTPAWSHLFKVLYSAKHDDEITIIKILLFYSKVCIFRL